MTTAKVGDFQRCCGDDTPVLWQTRRYGWTGHGFRQVGGPTAFPVNPKVTETGVTATDLVFGPATGGVGHGTLTVTVSYLWGTTPDHLAIAFSPPADVQREGAWPPVHPSQYGSFAVDVPTPAVGSTKTHTFAFSRPETGSGGDFRIELPAMTKLNVALSEANPYNDRVRITMRTAN